jgi:hypothetical protein
VREVLSSEWGTFDHHNGSGRLDPLSSGSAMSNSSGWVVCNVIGDSLASGLAWRPKWRRFPPGSLTNPWNHRPGSGFGLTGQPLAVQHGHRCVQKLLQRGSETGGGDDDIDCDHASALDDHPVGDKAQCCSPRR